MKSLARGFLARKMRGRNVTLAIAAALLALLGGPDRMNFAAEESKTMHAENTDKKEGLPLPGTPRILVAYFSHSGNTREIANQIHKSVGGDIFEIQTAAPYPDDYDTVVKQARRELDTGYKPALKTNVENIRSYDLVFIGYPNWWNTVPAPVRVFLSESDFSGKTLAPFCTHGGSGLGRSVADISKLCPKSTVLDGLAIPGSRVKTAQGQVSEWLQKIKTAK